MKKSLLFLMLISFSLLGTCQNVLKYRAYSFGYSYQLDNGKFTELEVSPSDVLITVAGDRIRIYATETETYDVVHNSTDTDNEGNTYLIFGCVDENGKRCTIQCGALDNGKFLWIISFSDIIWSYMTRQLD